MKKYLLAIVLLLVVLMCVVFSEAEIGSGIAGAEEEYIATLEKRASYSIEVEGLVTHYELEKTDELVTLIEIYKADDSRNGNIYPRGHFKKMTFNKTDFENIVKAYNMIVKAESADTPVRRGDRK